MGTALALTAQNRANGGRMALPCRQEFLCIKPLQREPGAQKSRAKMKGAAKIAIFSSAAAVSAPGCSLGEGGIWSVSNWIAGSVLALALLVAGVFGNAIYQWKRSRINTERTRAARVRQEQSQKQDEPQYPSGYVLGATPEPEAPVHVETQRERIARRLRVVDPNSLNCAAVPFVPMEKYMVNEPEPPKPRNMQELLASARNGNLPRQAQQVRREAKSGSAEMLKGQVDALWASLNRLKFHAMKGEPIAFDDRMNYLLQLVQAEQREFDEAYAAGNLKAAIESAIKMLANTEAFADWVQHSKGNMILVMGLAEITGKLKPLLEGMGMKQEHGVYFYGGSQRHGLGS